MGGMKSIITNMTERREVLEAGGERGKHPSHHPLTEYSQAEGVDFCGKF